MTDPKRHAVDWYGTFRGTEDDPREIGWCIDCGCEVYDGDSPEHEVFADE